MKFFNWSEAKNNQLKQERNIGFEDIILHMEQGAVVGRIKHPNQTKYPRQEVFLINIDDYIYLVQFVESEKEIFLKTIIPSRKAPKIYFKQGGRKHEIG